jgi:hypothetical protein
MLTIATAGLIPQICKERHRVSFDLYSPKSIKKMSVTFDYETGSALGWAALLYNLSSDWTSTRPEEAYRDLLKSVFYQRADEIQALLR